MSELLPEFVAAILETQKLPIPVWCQAAETRIATRIAWGDNAELRNAVRDMNKEIE